MNTNTSEHRRNNFETSQIPRAAGKAPTLVPRHQRSRVHFLEILFRLLDDSGVRYCVLHSWEGIPEELPSDLDLAVHPADAAKLPRVMAAVRAQGYRPVQCLNYFVNAYYFVFFWEEEDGAIDFAAIDIIFEHRRNGLIAPSGEELVEGRRRYKGFWIPDPAAEFVYLLAKKTWKGGVSGQQEKRIRFLARQLGRARTEELAGRLFLGKQKTRVVDACYAGNLDEVLSRAKCSPRFTSLARDPLQSFGYVVAEAVRQVRRWFRPTGRFVVILGPDGSGKTSVIKGLIDTVGPAFRRHRVFHWRPMLLCPRKDAGPVTDPHAQAPRSPRSSSFRIFFLLLDYWVGYALIIRPFLARSGLVIFDRYFDDLLVDPRRYRYGGPSWLVRTLLGFVPRPDLVLFLDTPKEQLLSRKREVPWQEVQRQRQAYLELAREYPTARIIDASHPLPQVVAQGWRAVADDLAARFEQRHRGWCASDLPGQPAVYLQP